MKGDNRGEKQWDKKSKTKLFTKGIEKIRNDFLVEENGFSDIEKLAKWHKDFFIKREKKFYDEMIEFLIKNNLPSNPWWWNKTMEHIIMNGKIKPWINLSGLTHPFIEIIGASIPSEGMKSGFYTDLRIYEGVAWRDMEDFVKKNWEKSIKPQHKLGVAKKLQPERRADINTEILELSKKSKMELSGKKHSDYMLKEEIIAEKINKKYGKNLSCSSIKKQLNRIRNRKR